MKINLKTAHRHVLKINKIINELMPYSYGAVNSNESIQTSISISLFDKRWSETYFNLLSKNSDKIDKLLTAMKIRQTIRNLIQTANQEQINNQISEKVTLEQMISNLQDIIQDATRQLEPFDTLNNRILHGANALNENSGHTEQEINTCGISEAKIEELKTLHKKMTMQVEELQDSLVHLNASTWIELSSEVVDFLKENDLVL